MNYFRGMRIFGHWEVSNDKIRWSLIPGRCAISETTSGHVVRIKSSVLPVSLVILVG